MKLRFASSLPVLLSGALCFLLSCDGSGGSSKPPVGPNINGSWRGTYEIRGAGGNGLTEITASVKQDGDSVVLRTSLPEEGAFLTGTIDANGEMLMTDAFDGELWTTHSQPATETYIDLDDFRFDLDDDAIAVMILTR